MDDTTKNPETLEAHLKRLHDVNWQATEDRPANFGMFLTGVGVDQSGPAPKAQGFRAGDVLVVEVQLPGDRLYYFADVRGEGRMTTGSDVESLLDALMRASPGAAASLASGLV